MESTWLSAQGKEPTPFRGQLPAEADTSRCQGKHPPHHNKTNKTTKTGDSSGRLTNEGKLPKLEIKDERQNEIKCERKLLKGREMEGQGGQVKPKRRVGEEGPC